MLWRTKVMLTPSHRKIKILFDGQQLAKKFIQNQTGVFRVSDEVFKRLCKRDDIDIYFLMTTNKGDPKKYLESIGHPEIPIIWMPHLLKTTKYRTIFHKTWYALLRLIMPFFYNDILRKFDLYFSPYAAISPVVYNAEIKTACICHDVIPMMFPHFNHVYKSVSKNFKDYVKYLSADFIFFVSNSARRDFLTFRTDFPFENTMVTYPGADVADVTNAEDINTGADDTTTTNCNNDSDDSLDSALIIRHKYGIPPGRYILALSEGNPRKNFVHIIKSFVKYLEDSGDNETSLVVGGKKLPNYDYVRETGDLFNKYKSKIIITGYVDEKDLGSIYKEASLFLYPSLYEGFGLPPLEAMKHGIPVIVANNSSLPEVCGDAAEYVSGFSINETVNAINKILSDNNTAATMRTKGLKQAAKFSFDIMVEKMTNEVHKFL
jgi:glycosyltransferase involved in cell wall biosynthesis